ncbi:MAG: hypothetical protein F6K56_29435 [Moorea sp. SIO3G5]|nr:hypothetical protein [Moorena sp. SIO3G5]
MPLAFPSWSGLGVGSSCLLPLASCLPLLVGVRGGFLLPLASPSWSGLGVGSSCLLPSPPGRG